MVIDILLILLMSDKLERVFSRARRTINWDRGQIEPETIKIKKILKILEEEWDSRYFFFKKID